MSAAIAVASVWIGLTASYLIPRMPPSFAILAVATAAFLAAIAVSGLRRGADVHAGQSVATHQDDAMVTAAP